MADFAQILIRAKDQTKGAFDSATQNVRGLESAASRLNAGLGAIGLGVTAAGLVAIAKRGIDAADALNDLSARTGVSVQTLAEWKLGAEQSGTSVDALGKGVQRLTLSIGEAEQGSKEHAAALQRLGVTARDPKIAFEQLADAVANSNDPLRTSADLQDVLGKSYAELLPLLQQGAQGLRDSAAASATFAEQMERLAPDADTFNDLLAKMKTNAAGATATILSELLPSFNEWALSTDRLIERHGVLLGLLSAIGAAAAPGVTASELSGSVSSQAFADELKKAKDELAVIEAAQKSGTFGLIQLALYGSRDEMERKRAYLESQISTIESSLDQFRTRQAEQNKGKGTAFDNTAQIACIASGGTWDGGTCVKKRVPTRTTKPAAQELIDALGTGSFKTYSKDVAEAIREQQDAINSLNSEIAKTVELYDALGSGSYLTGDSATADFIREQQDAINSLNSELAAEMQKTADKIDDTKSAVEEFGITFTSALEDAIVTGGSFSDMLKGLETDIARILVRKTVTDPLMKVDWTSLLGSILPSANGNAFSGVPGLSAYSGSVVDRPTLFPFAAGAGLMGEAGPEAILPLSRGPDGRLGVEGGGSSVQVNVINNAAGTQATATEREENGVRVLDVVIEQLEGAMTRRVGRGEGMAPVLERRYGLNPGAGAF